MMAVSGTDSDRFNQPTAMGGQPLTGRQTFLSFFSVSPGSSQFLLHRSIFRNLNINLMTSIPPPNGWDGCIKCVEDCVAFVSAASSVSHMLTVSKYVSLTRNVFYSSSWSIPTHYAYATTHILTMECSKLCKFFPQREGVLLLAVNLFVLYVLSNQPGITDTYFTGSLGGESGSCTVSLCLRNEIP
jgi:hypothetical protein